MKVFKTSSDYEIREFEATKETEQYYYVVGYAGRINREAKRSTWGLFHATRNAAENYLLNRIDRDIKYALEKIENLKKEREKLISGKSC